MVVPLFEASGTRYKILEAFAAKLPVISTRQGAEGLEVQDGKHLLIAEGAAEFASAVKQLAADEELANRLRENAFELIKENYSWKVIRGHIQKAVHELGTANLSTEE
jgi:glycosyltransferase involved in cell wall biosynthesis